MTTITPNNLMSWLAFAAMAIGGALALFYVFRNANKGLKKEENDTEDRVIKLLKDQREALDRKVADQDKVIEEQTKRIGEISKKLDEMIKENLLVKELNKERDSVSVEFREKLLESAVASDQNLRTTLRNEATLKEILKSINTLYGLIEKHLENEAKMLGKL